MIRITTDASEIDLRLAHHWISSSYWSTNIPWERFERACTNSLVYAAFDGEEQVGFARVVTDSGDIRLALRRLRRGERTWPGDRSTDDRCDHGWKVRLSAHGRAGRPLHADRSPAR